MVLKVGGACGRWPIGALPGQTDTVLSRSSVSSGSVLAGGRCQRHRPAKQSVLLKGVACPTHTHMITQTGGRGWCQISPSVNGPWTAYTRHLKHPSVNMVRQAVAKRHFPQLGGTCHLCLQDGNTTW